MTAYQPRLDFGESREAEIEADRKIRYRRAVLMERAAIALGMRGGKNPESGYILAGMLAVYVDSPSMREAGLSGLRWRGTISELADDPRLKCSQRTVKRLLARFEEAGLIVRRTLIGDRGNAGIEIELQARELQRFDVAKPPVPVLVPRDVSSDIPGDVPSDMGGDIPSDTARSVYSSVYPSSELPSSPSEIDDDGGLVEVLKTAGVEQTELAKNHAKQHRITLREVQEASEFAKHVWSDPRERGKRLYSWLKNNRVWNCSGVPTYDELLQRRRERPPDLPHGLKMRRRELIVERASILGVSSDRLPAHEIAAIDRQILSLANQPVGS